MNLNLPILLLVLLTSCSSPPEKSPETSPSKSISEEKRSAFFEHTRQKCDSTAERARADFAKGIRKYSRLGTVYATEFEQFYSNYMEEQYQVTMASKCVMPRAGDCYIFTLNTLIEEELGSNFLAETQKRAKELFESQTGKGNAVEPEL